jgi:hypothetical protein
MEPNKTFNLPFLSPKTPHNIPPINTWIGAKSKSGNPYNPNGLTNFEEYFELVRDVCGSIGVQLNENIETYLPEIYHYNLNSFKYLEDYISNQKKIYKKIVLISNGIPQSGQRGHSNIEFADIIDSLSQNRKDVLFILTENINLINDNVKYTSNITNIIPDLLEIGYISEFCDVIVGSSSGPHEFSKTKTNTLDSKKTFVYLQNSCPPYNFHKLSKSKWLHTSDYSINNLYSIINKAIDF